AEIFRLEHLADLDLALPFHGVGAALDPLDRLFLGLHLDQPEPGDQLLGLGERPVDDGALGARELDARALGARLQPLAREHHAGLDQLFVVLAHGGQELLAGHDARLGLRRGLDNHHESHRRASVWRWIWSRAAGLSRAAHPGPIRYVERGTAKSTRRT